MIDDLPIKGLELSTARTAIPDEDFRAVCEDIEAYMTSRLPAYEIIGDKAICPTGDAYIVLGIAGQVQQGEAHVATTDMHKAVEMFKTEFDKYAAGKDGGIYWRRKPAIDVDAYGECDFRNAYYRITARFVISDKPRLTTKED